MTTARPWMAVTAVVAGLLATAASASAQTQTFTGGAPLSFGELQAAPYPSTLDVAGLVGKITDVNVTLSGVSLTAANLDMVLVSPTGSATLLTSDVPTTGIVSQDWTFDDEASNDQATDQLTGMFKPTNLPGLGLDTDTLPVPAPAEFDGQLLSLDGAGANGTWKLYAASSSAVPALGSIAGWALQITTNLDPAISIDPSAIDFGSVGRNPQQSRTVTITNSGTAPLTMKLPDFFSPDFALSNQNIALPDLPCGLIPLQPGETCKVEVLFTPVTTGLKTATATIIDNAPGSPHSISLTGTLLEPPATAQQQRSPSESGTPDITVQQPQFSSTPTVGRPTTLHIAASDDSDPVTGVLVNFGETLGLYGASGCKPGMKPGDTTFDIPYTFLRPGSHTISVTTFAGGCGKASAHTTTFTIDVGTPKAARRAVAHAADTIVAPAVTSKCKNNAMLPSASKAKTKLLLKALLCVINEQRKLYKLKPLKLSKKLNKAALFHTRAMISGKFFAHQGPKEAALATRLKKARYRGSAGENIGAGGGPLGSPVGMVDGWMHSTLHRANLLSRSWRTVGIGFLAQFPLPTSSRPVATYTTDFGVR